MKRAESGSRGVFWRSNPRGTQVVDASEGKRERGDWWVRWSCRHGHLHRELIGPKSQAISEVEGRRNLAKKNEQHLTDGERGELCPKHRPRRTSFLLPDVIREYLAASKGYKRSHKDDVRYGTMWTERFQGRTLEDVTPADLERVKTERLEHVSAATVNRELAFLKHVYNVAMRDGKTERNPFARIKLLREPSGRVRYLTDDEEPRLLKALATEEDRQRLLVLLQTGLRKSEFLGVRWRDVDFKAGVLTIPRSKNGERRHVPMTSSVRSILARQPRSLDGAALVFPNSVGGHDRRWAEKAFPEAVTAARIEDFRLHDTRHAFASRLAMEGVDLLTIKELGGWRTLSMVSRYAHLSPSHRSQAIERLVHRAKTSEKEQASGAE
jgi:integrase